MLAPNRVLASFSLALIVALANKLLGNSYDPTSNFLNTLVISIAFYGVPVVLIREFAVHRNLGLRGLFIAGMAYGFYDEGLLWKSITAFPIVSKDYPMYVFNTYVYWGFNWAWGAFVLPSHALNSVIFPIALVSWLFPNGRHLPWLTRNEFAVLLGFINVAAIFFYTSTGGHSTAFIIVAYVVMFLLISISEEFPNPKPFLYQEGELQVFPVIIGILYNVVLAFVIFVFVYFQFPGCITAFIPLFLIDAIYFYVIRYEWAALRPFALLTFANYFSQSVLTLLLFLHRNTISGEIISLSLCALSLIGLFSVSRRKLEPISLPQ